MGSSSEFRIDFIDIAFDCHCKHAQIPQVVPQCLGGGDAVDGGESHNYLVHEGGVFDAIEGVLITVSEQACLCRCHQRLVEAHTHHRVVLFFARLGICPALQNLSQGGLIDLAITFDDVDGYTRAVCEGGDLFGALVPTHRSGATEEGLVESVGK